jgi:mannose-6-phosphate isomerase-like protein (cupin superfamily)
MMGRGPTNEEGSMEKVNLADKFSLFAEIYVPKIVGELNDQYVKLARIRGPYVWHDHENEDEMFLVIQGRMRIEFQDRTVELNEGEFLVIPRGVEHRPDADEEALVMLFEPKSTVNTGNVEHAYTKTELERI